MIPVVCVMEWVLHSKHYSREVKASVMVVVVGVGICTVTDVKVNAKGFICACTAVFSTSLQQIVSVLLSHSLDFVYAQSLLVLRLSLGCSISDSLQVSQLWIYTLGVSLYKAVFFLRSEFTSCQNMDRVTSLLFINRCLSD